MTRKILIVEDDRAVAGALREFLQLHDYQVSHATTVAGGHEACKAERPDVVLADYGLPDGNALDLLRVLQEFDRGVPVILLTSQSSIDLAVRAMKAGAEHFFSKPIELPALLVVLDRVFENGRSRRRDLARQSREQRSSFDPFLGTSAAIRALERQASRLGETDRPVLILGETGSGKSVLARWLHRQSTRAQEAFVDLNCAGLSKDLLDNELFGHERGAFTGASHSKQGLLEIAHRGTVFLDEIGDMDVTVQPKLLKVLEDQQFRRIGDVTDRKVDIRLIAATHRDLAQLVREERFRADLDFRVSTVPLRMPSLHERAEDIPALAQEMMARQARGGRQLSPRALIALQRYRWPGNLRELRNVLERAMLLSERTVLEPEDLLFEAQAGPTGDAGERPTPDVTIDELVRLHVDRVMREESGNVSRAARRLGIPKSTLYQRLKRMESVE